MFSWYLSLLPPADRLTYRLMPVFQFLKTVMSSLLGQLHRSAPDSGAADVLTDDDANRIVTELADARQRERALIERAVDVVCTIDSSGMFAFVSPSSHTAWGYRPADLLRKSVRQIVDEEGYERIMSYADAAEKSIERVIFETEIRCQNATIKHAMWRGHWSISDKTLFCIVHDMTEEKLMERTLRESEKRLKDILEFLPAGVLIASQTGVVEFANAASRVALGYSAVDPAGENIADLFTEFPQYQVRLHRRDELAVRLDGARTPVEVHKEMIELAGTSKQLLVFVEKSALYDLEKAKQDFFAMVAHDLSAPLTALKGLVVLIEEGVLESRSEQVARVSGRVDQECNQLLRLVSDMVDLGKMGSSSFVLKRDHKQALAVIASAVDGIISTAERKNVSIDMPAADDSYFGDELRVKQVLTNLLINAIKYSPDGANISVLLSEETEERTGERFLRFAVQDQGAGIAVDQLERIFEKYEQIPQSDGKAALGSGLGLAICKLIVQRHGGQIGCQSTVGQGSLFWFTIPCSPDQGD